MFFFDVIKKIKREIIRIILIMPDGSCIDRNATNIESGKIKKNIFFLEITPRRNIIIEIILNI